MKFPIPVLRFLLGASVLMAGPAAHAKEAIVGGKAITIKEAPWQLLLLAKNPDGSQGNCGAAWIGGKWVITAAHCIEEEPIENLYIYAGITRRDQAKAASQYRVARAIPQPDYPRQWKDIAILELEKPITALDAQPIRMATPQDVTAGYTRPGAQVMATGWGGVNRDGRLADTLQMVLSQVHDTTRWTINWAGLGGIKQVGSCGGDSGGPCVVKDGTGAWILAGISSTISSYCGDPDSPSSYTRVSSFHTWVTGFTGAIVTSIQPPSPAGNGLLLFTGDGRLTLRRSQTLEWTVANLTGAVLERTRRFYPAGEYPLPATGAAPHGAILRIRGEGVDIRRSL